MAQRLFQHRHARQVKRHVAEGAGGWPPLVEGNRYVVISNRDSAVELELLFQTERALEPFRASFRAAHRQSEVADHAHREWSFFPHGLLKSRKHSDRIYTYSRNFGR